MAEILAGKIVKRVDATYACDAAIKTADHAYAIFDLYKSSNVDCQVQEAAYAMRVAEKQLAFEALVAALRDEISGEEALHAAKRQEKGSLSPAEEALHEVKMQQKRDLLTAMFVNFYN